MPAPSIKAVLWDFGGVLTTSPFEAFNRFERERGLPENFLRGVNATNPDTNAWAQFERNEITREEFDARFAEESTALGHEVPGRDVMALLAGSLRPGMIKALKRCKAAGLATACITNNVVSDEMSHQLAEVMGAFDHVFESSKIGIRKPDPRIYEMACGALGIPPAAALYLDDLGVNLKPARAMGMATIKVVSEAQALDEMEAILNLPLR